MSIKPLPQSVIQHIQCSTGLPDRFTIVKELLENAIDACLNRNNWLKRDSHNKYDTISDKSDVKRDKSKRNIIIRITPSKISVTDTGCGISPSDLLTIGRKNWTSKLPQELFEDVDINGQRPVRDINDSKGKTDEHGYVFHDSSIDQNDGPLDINMVFLNPFCLGFRGEALSLIKECSQVEIRSGKNGIAYSVQLQQETFNTRNNEEVTDHTENIPHQKEIERQSLQRIPYVEGTTVTVSNIFHNMPLKRKKMCKEYKKENERIRQMVLGYALSLVYEHCAGKQKNENSKDRCCTTISFSMYVNDKNICITSTSEDLAGLFSELYSLPSDNRVLTDIAIDFFGKQLVSNFSVFTTPVVKQKIINHSSADAASTVRGGTQNNTVTQRDEITSNIVLFYSYSSKPLLILMVNGRYCRNKQIERLVQFTNSDHEATISFLNYKNTPKGAKNNLLAHRRTLIIFITTHLVDHNTEGKLDLLLADEIIQEIEKMLQVDGVKSLQKNVTHKEIHNKERPSSIKIYKQETDLPQIFRAYGKKDLPKRSETIRGHGPDQKTNVVGLYEDTLFLQQNDQLVVCTFSDVLIDLILKYKNSRMDRKQGTKNFLEHQNAHDSPQNINVYDLRTNSLLIVYDFLVSDDIASDSNIPDHDRNGLKQAFKQIHKEKGSKIGFDSKSDLFLRLTLVESFTTKNELNDLLRFLMRNLKISDYTTIVTDLKSIYRAVGR